MIRRRFVLTFFAEQDLTAIAQHLQTLPEAPARRIGSSLRLTLESLAVSPDLSRREAFISGTHELRSRLSAQYRIYYHQPGKVPEIVAILHYAQDHTSILLSRLT